MFPPHPDAAADLARRTRLIKIGCVANAVLLAGLVTTVAVVIPGLARTLGSSTASGDEAQIRAVLTAQVDAWNKGNLDAFLTGYHDSPDLFFITGGTDVRGFPALRDRYRKKYQADGAEMGTLAFRDLHVDGFSPNAAMVRGRWELSGDKVKPAAGWFTLILRKQPGGWKITHDHTSH